FNATLVLVDMAPYLEAAKLLYEGAFVAERYDAVGDFIDAHPEDVDPTVRKIISGARDIPAYQYYRDQRRLEELKATTSHAMTNLRKHLEEGCCTAGGTRQSTLLSERSSSCRVDRWFSSRSANG
ncbi:hypothetical protein ACFQ1S_27900, partial [Kibdelosporangium lantanae]